MIFVAFATGSRAAVPADVRHATAVTDADRRSGMTTPWPPKAAVERITVPTYVVSSYTNKVHTRGTIHAFNALTVQDKWLRIHNTHEWRDFYRNQEDLLRFFDRYLKGVDNGWESTPRVRMSVLDPGGEDETNIVTDSFPPPGTEPVRPGTR